MAVDPTRAPDATSPGAPADLRTELANAAYEPLLPIEKKLIGWSLGLGIVLLVLLAIISRLFPVG